MKMTTAATHKGYVPQAGLFSRVRVYLAKSTAARQLHALDDRLLSDIGVTRSNINSSVWAK